MGPRQAQTNAHYFCRRTAEEPIPDVSHGAQITSIEASFRDPLTELEWPKLRHPTKPNLRAVDSYEVFPDARIWANAYDLVKFSERPGDRPPEVRFHFLSNNFHAYSFLLGRRPPSGIRYHSACCWGRWRELPLVLPDSRG